MTVQDREAIASRLVEAYDFRRPTTLAREHSRILEAGFESFSRQWGTQLTAKVRAKSTVTAESVVMQTYDEYVASLPATTSMVLCAVEDAPAKAVLQFPTPAALGWVARMLGGHSDRSGVERKFTPLEYALIKSLVDEALEVLAYSLSGLLPVPPRVEAIQYNSQFAQAAATTDLMIVVAFTVHVGDSAAAVTLAIPADALLPQLGAVNPMASIANARELVGGQIAEVPIEVAVRLEPAAVTPAQVLNLAVGDTLALPHPEHHPFHVAVGGKVLAQAMVVRKGSRVAARIVPSPQNAPLSAEEKHL
ncbi:flagellar motor switch protein FliM [Sinomonas susongensis]|uniref:flagellar motor switch protein FliM n=1 Tax=Sinomonas susongensis TaxID=1324851 RepID=UPI0011090684|nr:flagellar motor switch protein FliM [Sinomonas susongensis]